MLNSHVFKIHYKNILSSCLSAENMIYIKKTLYSNLTYIFSLPGVYPDSLLIKTNQWSAVSQSSEELVKFYAFWENTLATFN